MENIYYKTSKYTIAEELQIYQDTLADSRRFFCFGFCTYFKSCFDIELRDLSILNSLEPKGRNDDYWFIACDWESRDELLRKAIIECNIRLYKHTDKKMLTVEQWLHILPNGYRELALKNLNSTLKNEYLDTLAGAIHRAFLWRNTKEGSVFWEKVHNHYNCPEESPLPKLPESVKKFNAGNFNRICIISKYPTLLDAFATELKNLDFVDRGELPNGDNYGIWINGAIGKNNKIGYGYQPRALIKDSTFHLETQFKEALDRVKSNLAKCYE